MPSTPPARILPQIVHAVGRRTSQARDGKIIDPYLLRLPLRPPFASRVLEIAHHFFLLGIHRHHWLTPGKKGLRLSIDLLELRMAVRVVSSLTRLAVRL